MNQIRHWNSIIKLYRIEFNSSTLLHIFTNNTNKICICHKNLFKKSLSSQIYMQWLYLASLLTAIGNAELVTSGCCYGNPGSCRHEVTFHARIVSHGPYAHRTNMYEACIWGNVRCASANVKYVWYWTLQMVALQQYVLQITQTDHITIWVKLSDSAKNIGNVKPLNFKLKSLQKNCVGNKQ